MIEQEPRDQFEGDPMEDEIEEVEDASGESPLSDSDSQTETSESLDVPADQSSDDSVLADEDEIEEPEVPAIENLPLSSSDELPPPEPTEGPAWYVIHCYSGYENKVRHNLEQRIETMGMKDKIFDVVIPTQEEIEVKDGKRRTVERHIFPGYVLVNMALTEESWYVVRNTPGVTGFVGMGNNPTPLRPEEVAQIVKRMEAEAPTVKVTFKVGERVRIIDGPFNDFRGVVSEIDMERTKVRVMVSFFGRETPVELDFLQVEKA
jgi:transcriptional antiterminator NusG